MRVNDNTFTSACAPAARALACLLVLAALLCFAAPPARASEGISLTDEERSFIQSLPVLKVGYVSDRVPVSFEGENGELSGISRFIFDRIASLTGLRFSYSPLPTGDVTYTFLQEQGYDLVTSVEYNEANKHARGITMSDPYFTSRKVVVTDRDLVFDVNAPLTVALYSGSQTIRSVLAATYPNFIIKDFGSITECFDALLSGDADLVIQNQYVVEYWFSKPAYEDLRVIPVMGMDDRLCFSAVVSFDNGAGRSPEDGDMIISIIDKAIAAISEDELGTYTIQGIMDNQYDLTLGDFIYRYRFAFGIFAAAAVIIIAMTILLLRQKMRALRARMEAQAKGQFLSTMSHEIRTPLNGLIGLNYLMGQKLDDREQLEVYLRQSTATAKYLLSLVNDILDMSRIQENRMVLSKHPVDLGLIISSACDLVRGDMDEKTITFNVTTDLDAPCVLGDEIRIQQVLMNLLDNARKFTSRGGDVTLRVTQSEGRGGDVVTSMEVSDTGRGMSEEFQKRVFYSFTQELDTVSKGNQGTGLGLAISKSLATAMGGELTFVSRKGVGSTFTFTFPGRPVSLPEAPEDQSPAPAPAPEAEAEPENLPAPRRVLVAEDNELNREIMVELLLDEGYEAVTAVNGAEAVEEFRASRPGSLPVILMDLLMPEMDGFAAARAIRALPRPDAGEVHIIACTANSFEEDRERAYEAGMNDFIPKPVDIDLLLEKLDAIFSGREQSK